MAVKQVSTMASAFIRLDDLTAEQRIELMGHLWDSLDAAIAAPTTNALVAELDQREAEADSDPQGGNSLTEIKTTLGKKLRQMP